MRFPETLTGLRSLRFTTLAAGLSLLTPGALLAESAGQNDVSALKAQMERMQKQYEERISSMESEMKSLESKANSGSILNTRLLTDANGVAMDDKGGKSGPMLDESFLKSLTRNFTFTAYIRSGVGFNGRGAAQTYSYASPENPGGRFRLGNENDTYMELTWKQAHMLGEGAETPNVSMTFTPAFVYSIDKATFVTANPSSSGWQYSMRQAFIEMSNFIKSAPEVTIWGGERFYDRHDIHLHDYFFDDYSGYGMGIQNIDLGFGKLDLAYLGGIRDDISRTFNDSFFQAFRPNAGDFYMHTFDARIKDINLGPGKLELIGDIQYLKGGNYNITFKRSDQDVVNAVDTLYINQGLVAPSTTGAFSSSRNGVAHLADDVWGARVGAIYNIEFGNKSLFQVAALGGWGASRDFGTDLPSVIGGQYFNKVTTGSFNNVGGVKTVDISGITKAYRLRANAQLVWNVSDSFVFQAEAHWQHDNQGYRNRFNTVNVLGAPGPTITTPATANIYGGGIRPIFWLSDWFALQLEGGVEYQDTARVAPAAADGGWFGKVTFAPTIKPKGGYYSRPEFRVFGSYFKWSDALRGTVGDPSSTATDGWMFGVQTEWFF